MTVQFIVAFLVFILAVIFTAGLWLQALQQAKFRNVTKFYKGAFIGLACGLASLVWIQIFAVINADISGALFQGVSAAFIVFVLFAWGRLTALGLKHEATHQALAE